MLLYFFDSCILYGFSHLLFEKQTAFIIICIVFVLDAILFVFGMNWNNYRIIPASARCNPHSAHCLPETPFKRVV